MKKLMLIAMLLLGISSHAQTGSTAGGDAIMYEEVNSLMGNLHINTQPANTHELYYGSYEIADPVMLRDIKTRHANTVSGATASITAYRLVGSSSAGGELAEGEVLSSGSGVVIDLVANDLKGYYILAVNLHGSGSNSYRFEPTSINLTQGRLILRNLPDGVWWFQLNATRQFHNNLRSWEAIQNIANINVIIR